MTAFRNLRRTATVACLGLGVVASAETLTVVSWGGSYEQASRKAILEPFSKETGIEIRVETYNGGLAQVRAQVETGKVYWDVVDFEMADASRGCDEGLLEYVDVDDLAPAPDGTPPAEDFFEGTVIDCGGGLLFYSTIYAYNADSFPDEKPSTIDDFFDLDRFPGRRGMRRAPQVNLEFALLADGVSVEEVYDTLGTPAGMSRAYRKLDTIKDDIVWWEAGAQPPQMLADREVVMSTAYNGRIFNAQVVENQPFVVVWDGQVLDSGTMGIVTGTPNLEAARKLVRYATRSEVQAAVGRYISYSPARHSGTKLISTHLATGVDMVPHMPTSPQNMKRVLYNDWEWWSDHADDVNERFSAWLAR
ncbi:MAG: ABC transporter substrate-binding protein [Gammaproteobacteria bacterium]|nr:ABC transporter substrate-binding protein [Gammaproteobacteria bacterium]